MEDRRVSDFSFEELAAAVRRRSRLRGELNGKSYEAELLQIEYSIVCGIKLIVLDEDSRKSVYWRIKLDQTALLERELEPYPPSFYKFV